MGSPRRFVKEHRNSPGIQITQEALDRFKAKLNPHDIWVDYDGEIDTLFIYGTGEPVRGICVEIMDNTYVIVEPVNHEIVGFQVETWEKEFVPAHTELKATWSTIKASLTPEDSWSQLLRMITPYFIFLFNAPPPNNHSLQPA